MAIGPPAPEIRQHERWQCQMECVARVGPDAAAQVRVSARVASRDGGVPGELIDCSKGGMGLRTGVFMPKGAELLVDVTLPEGGSVRLTGRVQRVTMLDRTPTYYLGIAFVANGSEASGSVERLLGAASRGGPAPGRA